MPIGSMRPLAASLKILPGSIHQTPMNLAILVAFLCERPRLAGVIGVPIAVERVAKIPRTTLGMAPLIRRAGQPAAAGPSR
jgi:hypothetical protein